MDAEEIKYIKSMVAKVTTLSWLKVPKLMWKHQQEEKGEEERKRKENKKLMWREVL